MKAATRQNPDASRPQIAFLLEDFMIAGGIAVLVEYASELRRFGFDVHFITDKRHQTSTGWHPALSELSLLTYDAACKITFAAVAATWWRTCEQLHRIRASRYIYFVQSVESRFYHSPEEFLKPLVTATYFLPVTFITEAKWISSYLRALNPTAKVYYVRNGVNKELFRTPETLEVSQGPLRIMVEGPLGVWFKETQKAVDIAASLDIPKDITLVSASDIPADIAAKVNAIHSKVPLTQMAQLYSRCDILLKLSRVEGMFGPPLEAFHCGATAVCNWVTGCEEYLVHGWNSLLCAPDDYDSIHRQLLLLHHDRRLLHFLRSNAVTTARGWPSWQQAARFLAVVLSRIMNVDSAPDTTMSFMIPALAHKSLRIARRQTDEQIKGLQLRCNVALTEVHNKNQIITSYERELRELRSFKDIILGSGSYRLARKLSKIRLSWPLAMSRQLVPTWLKARLKKVMMK